MKILFKSALTIKHYYMVSSRGKPNKTKKQPKKSPNKQKTTKKKPQKNPKPKPQQTIKPTNKPALENTDDHGSVLGG